MRTILLETIVLLKTTILLETLKVEASRMTIIGFVLIFLGMLAMASPLVAGVSVSMLIGILLAASGLNRLFFVLQSKSGQNAWLTFCSGELLVLCGMLMIIQPLFGLQFMMILLVAYLLMLGVSEILHAFQLRPSKGWNWVLASGVVSLLLSKLIWRHWPLSGAWAIGVLVGVKLLVSGVAITVVGIAARTMIHEEQARL